jgi:hypothetical protein
MQTHDSEVPGAKKSLGVGASKPASKLTESIMALAGFKGKEAELTKIAHSTVAAAAAVSSPIVGEGPIASRTRRSLEGSKKSLGSARKGAPTSGKDARKSEEKKRVHNAGASTTPSKSVTKKPRTEEKRPVASKEAKTPSFERFGGARGRRTGVLSTPNGRSSSAPAPRSGRKMVKCFPAHGLSRGLLGCGSGMHVLTSFWVFSGFLCWCAGRSLGVALPHAADVELKSPCERSQLEFLISASDVFIVCTASHGAHQPELRHGAAHAEAWCGRRDVFRLDG